MEFFVLFQPFLDPVVRIQDIRDGGIMVHGINQKRDVLGDVTTDVPFFLEKVRSLVGTVGGDHFVDSAVLISLVKGGKAIGEHTEG